MAVSFRSLAENDVPEVCNLFQTVFGQSLSEDGMLWKHFRHPLSDAVKAAKVVAIDDGKIIGTCFALPAMFCKEGESFPAAQTVDVCLHPDYRGQQLTYEFYQEFEQRIANHVSFAYGWPGKTSFAFSVLGLGYSVIGTKQLFAHRFQHGPLATSSGISLSEPVIELDVSDDVFALVDSNQNKLHQFKDHAFWNWRYASEPTRQFKMLQILHGKNKIGLVAVRIFAIEDYQAGCIYDLTTFREDHESVLSACMCELSQPRFGLSTLYALEGDGPFQRPLLERYEFSEVAGGDCVSVYKPYANSWISPTELESRQVWNLTAGDSDW